MVAIEVSDAHKVASAGIGEPEMNVLRGVALLLVILAEPLGMAWAQDRNTAEASGSYTTDFRRSENPCSEEGRWINSGANGGGRSNVQSTPGLAFGTQIERGLYNDSIALMTGTWSADQTVTVTLYKGTNKNTCCAEGEIWIRGSMGGGKMTGYEMSFSILSDPDYYHMAPWLGADFAAGTFARSALGRTLQDGDVIKVTAVGNLFTLYVNSIQIAQGTDNTYASGNPGIGFFHSSAFNGLDHEWGFNSFAATGLISSDLSIRVKPIAVPH